MRLIDFEESNITVAGNQDEYITMPAHIDKNAVVTACWELTLKEIWQIFRHRKVWVRLLTFNCPVTPHRIDVTKPDFTEE